MNVETDKRDFFESCLVTWFPEVAQAEEARRQLASLEFAEEQLKVLHGDEGVQSLDASQKWFSDADIRAAKYKRALQQGGAVLVADVADCGEELEALGRRLAGHGARYVTHFGPWVTEVLA